MSITVISGTTPANTGQLATPSTTNFSIAFVSSSYSASYAASSTTASLREVAITAFSVEGVRVVFYSGSTDPVNTADTIYINDVPFTTSAANFTATASVVFNTSASVAYSNTNFAAIQGISSSISAVGQSSNNCSNNAPILSVINSASLTYQWSNNGNLISGANSHSIIAINSGNYSVAIIGGTNCATGSILQTLTVNPSPTITISGANNICLGSSLSQTLSGAVSYSK